MSVCWHTGSSFGPSVPGIIFSPHGQQCYIFTLVSQALRTSLMHFSAIYIDCAIFAHLHFFNILTTESHKKLRQTIRPQNNLERAEHYVRPFAQIMNNSFLFNSSSFVYYVFGKRQALFPPVQPGPHYITMHCCIYSSVCLLVNCQMV